MSRADFTRQSTERSLQELKDSDYKQYKVDTSGDSRVCDACKAQDGKVYNIKDAVIGVNAPPFCDECRCIIMPVFGDFETEDSPVITDFQIKIT